jgi:cyanophycinase
MSFIRKTLLLKRTSLPDRQPEGNSPHTPHRLGQMILVGGAEDKKDRKTVLKYLLDQLAPKSILLIPTASQYPRDVADGYRDAFQDLQFREIEILDIRYPEDADRAENLEKASKADLLFFTGGDQVKLVTTIEGSTLMDLVRARFSDGSLHLAGSSAGTAAMSEYMLFDGDDMGLVKGRVKAARGFNFLPGFTLDTHFGQRNRYQRLAQFIAAGYTQSGIGIDEDTAAHFFAPGKFRVVGSNQVTIMQSGPSFRSNYHQKQEGETFEVRDLQISLLPPGTVFNFQEALQGIIQKQKAG